MFHRQNTTNLSRNPEPGTRNQSRREAFVPEGLDEALLASETKGGGESRSGKDEASDFLRELLASGALPVLRSNRRLAMLDCWDLTAR